jgi:tRNA pseudouridine32 synthase
MKRLRDVFVAGSIENVNRASSHRYFDKKHQVYVLEPYLHVLPSYAKSRWLNRTILDVVLSEFGSHDEAYFRKAIELGTLLVNGEKVSKEYVFKSNDYLEHIVHRHEPNIKSIDISTLYEDDKVWVVNKPGGIPVHASGPYYYNTLLGILRSSFPAKFQQFPISSIHRIDRLTSGIVILTKDKEKAKELSNLMTQENSVEKEYLALVDGKFEFANFRKEFLRKIASSVERLLEKENGCFIDKESGEIFADKVFAALDPDEGTGVKSFPDDFVLRRTQNGFVEVRIKLKCLDQKNAIHGVIEDEAIESDSKEKTTITLIKVVEFDEVNNKSLLLVKPVTGRTHQIRVVLQHLGFPIDNDPLYNKKFYQELVERDEKMKDLEEEWKKSEKKEERVDEDEARDSVSASSSTDAKEDEVSDHYLSLVKQTCVACSKGIRCEFNVMQRTCFGIHLYSKKYIIRDEKGVVLYSFEAPNKSFQDE